MINHIIREISNSFILEAKNSPQLLADMAAMEKYMAESYSGRIFVELLQNADDCNSERIFVKQVGRDIYFANDGHPFTEQDIIAICRSGASSKERGQTIGYRGIGFKSTTYLTDEIIIYSDETYFSFSRKICADILNTDVSKVPMIRVPILTEEDLAIADVVKDFVRDGYQTVFIFRNAKINEFIEELKTIDNGYFIFLRNVVSCTVETDTFSTKIQLSRKDQDGTQLISFSSKKDSWLVHGGKKSQIAFRYSTSEKCIVECDPEESLYHSYLPTLDKTPFTIKINADFSTDPSRKHMTLDENSERAIAEAASLIAELISSALNGTLPPLYKNLFSIFSRNDNFSKANSLLKSEIKADILRDCQVTLGSGNVIPINEYKLFPEWLEPSEQFFLRTHAFSVQELSIKTDVYKQFPDVDTFLSKYAAKYYENDDLVDIMQDAKLVKAMSPGTQGKILGKIIKKERFNRAIKSAPNKKIGSIKVSTSGDVKELKKISSSKEKLNSEILHVLNSDVSSSDLDWFEETFDVPDVKEEKKSFSMFSSSPAVEKEKPNIKPHISKWRSAEQQCLEIEKFYGNTAKDVSKQNIGYDIESITPDGNRRLIEVKSIKEGGEFSITNNEYTAAHQYGKEYYLCLMIQNDDSIKVTYINNPLETVSFEKRIRQWEWVCEDYSGKTVYFEY